MLDLSFIGKEGFIVQYEDIISLMGYNVLHALREHGAEVVRRVSDEDILRDYINREIEDPASYLMERYEKDIWFPKDSMYNSRKTMRPNLNYVFRFFDVAYKNGIRNLYVHTNQKSESAEYYIRATMSHLPVTYTYGDIVPVLRKRSNMTYLTSCTENIRKCLNVGIPFALMIVDDFPYVAPVAQEDFVRQLRERNIFVGFTSILSAGLNP